MSVDIASLIDIREAIDRARSFVADLDYKQFLGDEKTMWAVYGQVIVIGEAANRISKEFQAEHSRVPWRKMISMRHHLVHGYDEIKWDRVWDTVVNDFPKLTNAIEPLIPKEP
jgi:uncharacterized protein with HEPN domain